jgi:acetyl esterase/lipase
MTVRFQRHRLEPHNYAASVFENGVRKGRILIVDNQYDVYLPPQYNNGRGENSRNPRVIDKALYFIPGTLLSPTVYAEVMAALSNKGILVIVRNTEPYFRLPDETFGLTMVDALTSIHDLKQRFAITVHEWSFGGHGHGGHVAAKIVQELWKEAPKDAIGMADKLVLWGLYSMESPVDLRPCSMKTLLVTATRDGFRPTGDEWTAELLSRLPVNTTLKDIPGGNHSGFGTYGPQRFYRQDGARYISLYEQHRQIVQATAVFLGGTKPYSKKKKTSSLNHTPKHCWKCTS